jgi:hypothetical protein
MHHCIVRSILAAWAVLFLAACSATPTPHSASPASVFPQGNPGQTSGLIRSRAGELVYVADANGPVAAYPARSKGNTSPALTVLDPNLQNTFWNPWGVTFDKHGYLYVQSFLSEATTFVFPPGADSDEKPSRVFMGNGPDTRSIAVDSAGYEYIASTQQPAEIDVLAPKANGNPNNGYHVNPLRSISTDEAVWFPWPDILTIGSREEIIAGIVRSPANAIEVYTGGPSGGGSPIRVVSGPHTRLGSCSQSCQNIAVTFSLPTKRIYVAVSAGGPLLAHISTFAENANGDAAPLRTIEGSKTRLSGQVITGIAVSARTGEIYAMVKSAQFSPGEVLAYARNANGNTAPERAFIDPATSFTNAQGIAIR